MNPTSNAPSGSHGNASAPGNLKLDASLSSNEPTSGPAGSSYKDYKQKDNDGIQSILDSGKQGWQEGREWLASSDMSGKAKDLGSQALSKFNDLTTTQKIVGVGLLTAGIAFLATRGKKHKDKGEYRLKDRHSPFAKKSKESDQDRGPRAQQRPWGSSRYGSSSAPASAGKGRVMAGSGPKPGPKQEHPDHQRDHGQRPTPLPPANAATRARLRAATTTCIRRAARTPITSTNSTARFRGGSDWQSR
ncbi:hypothetical protein A0257_13195 [Hymenobacter psoromatis]|nr:hypothetical protein A0257_13195 [Hymenobacter psoromatis]